jgi:hypothetical protein
VAFPTPVPGLVICYSYLWHGEHLRGQEEGRKNRPCVVLLALTDEAGDQKVIVLPITHSQPDDPAHGVEIPAATKRRLGLDDARSWIILSESNRFTWPGPDLRPAVAGDPTSIAYGELPRALFDKVRTQWLALFNARRARIVRRTE